MDGIVIGMNGKALNNLVSALYGRKSIREKYFKGSEYVKEICLSIAYDIKTKPEIDMNSPTSVVWEKAFDAKGKNPKKKENCFTVLVKDMDIGSSNGEKVKSVPLTIICSAEPSGGNIRLSTYAISLDMQKLDDFAQGIYQLFLIPAVLNALSAVLSTFHIPAINFAGMKISTDSIAVKDNALILFSGKSIPSFSMPADEFFVLEAPNVLRDVVNKRIDSLKGTTKTASGTQSIGIGKAWYKASLRLDNIYVNNVSNPHNVDVRVSFTPSAGAGVTVMWVVPLDVTYKGKVSPHEVSLTTELFFSGTILKVRLKSLGSFNISLEPTSVIAGLTWVIAQTIVSVIEGLASNIVKGTEFDLLNVDSTSVNINRETFSLTPGNLSLSEHSGMVRLGGNITVK